VIAWLLGPCIWLADSHGVARAQSSTLDQYVVMYGHSDDVGTTDAFREDVVPAFTVIEGTSSNASFIKELRDQGKVYAAHVNNLAGETAQQLLARWQAPFQNTLGGQLPGGYDAIAIDELLGASTNGTANSDAVVSALGQLRNLYPDKGIYAATTWQYGSQSSNYTDQLNALNTYADLIMVENYLREDNYNYGYFSSWADNLKSAVPGILERSVYGLYIPQGGYVADTSTNVGFWGFLDDQLHRIRNDADATTMPGVMFWPYYRSEKDLTPDYVSRLVDHYYLQENTSFFGDGGMEQLITNPQFEGNTNGWSLTTGTGGSLQTFNYSSVGIESDHDNFGQASHGSAGLKMVRGSTPNEAAFQVNGLDPNMVYTVSAFVVSETPNQRAQLSITELDGTLIELEESSTVGSPPDYYYQWNEWSRLDFHFVPTASSINVVLGDATTANGTTLYWDFVELEAAYPVDTPLPAPLDDYQWVATAGGNWHAPSNWSPGTDPDSNKAFVHLTGATAATADIELLLPVSVAKLELDNSSDYRLVGKGQLASLQLETESQDVEVNVLSGEHTFDLPVVAHANTVINVAAGASLTLGGTVDFDGVKLSKLGSGAVYVQQAAGFGSGTVELHDGTLTWEGDLNGDLLADTGVIAPGIHMGHLDVKGDFTLGAAATLELDIAGPSSSSNDLLTVDDAAELSGTLAVDLHDGFRPDPGDRILVMIAGSITNNGLALDGPDARYFQLSVGSSTLILDAVAPTSMQWVNSSGGNWNSFANWSSSSIPNSDLVTARLTGSTAPLTAIEVSSPVTLRELIVDDSSSYWLVGSDALHLDGQHGQADIVVTGGDHRLDVKAHADADTTFFVDSGATLTLANTLQLDNTTIFKEGEGILYVDAATTGNGTFEVTGGTLAGDGTVGGDLTASAGFVAPGHGVGRLDVQGDFALAAEATLQIDLAGPSSTDLLVVSGEAELGGSLEVVLGDGYQPELGSQFLVMIAGGVTDNGLTLSGPYADQFSMTALGSTLVLESLFAGLAGDYSGDGTVDAADYNIWRDSLGQSIASGTAADGNGNGIVDQADYELWKANFGTTATSGSLAATSEVPEPGALVLLLILVTCFVNGFRRNRY
jgi:hypothetical protein